MYGGVGGCVEKGDIKGGEGEGDGQWGKGGEWKGEGLCRGVELED